MLRTRVNELEVIHMMVTESEATMRKERDEAVHREDELKRRVAELEERLADAEREMPQAKKAKLSEGQDAVTTAGDE